MRSTRHCGRQSLSQQHARCVGSVVGDQPGDEVEQPADGVDRRAVRGADGVRHTVEGPEVHRGGVEQHQSGGHGPSLEGRGRRGSCAARGCLVGGQPRVVICHRVGCNTRTDVTATSHTRVPLQSRRRGDGTAGPATGAGSRRTGLRHGSRLAVPAADPVSTGSLAPDTSETILGTRGRNAPCRPSGPRRRVTLLPDLVVPALKVPPYRTAANTVLVEGFTVPAQRVEAGAWSGTPRPGAAWGPCASPAPSSRVPPSARA